MFHKKPWALGQT